MSWFDWLGFRSAAATRDESRWVMIDVETSGLDVDADALLAIAAVAMRVDWEAERLSIRPVDSFEVLLCQKDIVSTKDNIILHGIGVQAQRGGVAPRQAMQALSDYVAGSPLLAFHAAFDKAVIERQLRLLGLPGLKSPWVDVEHLCAVTHEAARARSLDDWMAYFSIDCAVRHQAASDALAQCEVLQRIWPQLCQQCANWQDLERLARQRRWLAAH